MLWPRHRVVLECGDAAAVGGAGAVHHGGEEGALGVVVGRGVLLGIFASTYVLNGVESNYVAFKAEFAQ